MAIILFNLCTNPTREILFLSFSTDMGIKEFPKVTKHVNDGDLNASSLIKGPCSKPHFTHEGQGAENQGNGNSKMGKVLRHVILRKAFVEEIHQSNTLRLIK